MVNYYQILKVSPKASKAEIKSAYRRLAREMHPDINSENENAHEEFAILAKAYEVLSNPKERALYDRRLNGTTGSIHTTDSVLASENAHAKRWRRMALDRKYNQIIDQIIAEERRETLARQKAVFPTVALFISTLFVGIFKPSFWENSPVIGKLIIFTLFVIGVLHLIKRVKSGFEKYTYDDDALHDSILDGKESELKPFTRIRGIAFLFIGVGVSFIIGLLINQFIEMYSDTKIVGLFSPYILPEFVFYPPIIALLVDFLHTIISKFEY